MVNIGQQLVSESVIEKRSYGFGNPCDSITIHETDNWNKNADAQAHANLQTNLNPREASWQYQVDDKEVIQSFPDGVECWAAGDGRGPGNTGSIHIEICVNSDGDFKKAVKNASDLTKILMDRHNLKIDRVEQHNNWSGKNCPRFLRSGEKGINWNEFIEMVNGKNHKQKPEPDTKVKSEDIVWYLQKGDQGPRVGDLQSKLRALGYNIGQSGIDDRFGPDTKAALMAFQKHEGIEVDGLYGPESQRTIKTAEPITKSKIGPSVIPYPGYHFELRSPQMHDRHVGQIQYALNTALGYKKLKEDDYYGEKTAHEVGEYQERHDLVRDEMVGPITWSTLF